VAGAAGGAHRSFASFRDDSYFLSGGAAGGSQAQQAKVKGGGQECPPYAVCRSDENTRSLHCASLRSG